MCRSSRLILEGRSRVVLIASRACGERGQRWVREARAGRVVPVSPRLRADERRCQVRLAGNSSAMSTRPRNIAANQRAVRTAKPCGPGRRRYGQAFRGGVERPTGSTASPICGAREARRNSAPGRARHKPSNHCAGKAECSAPPVCCCAVFLRYTFRAADRGCEVGTRSSLRPLGFERVE